MELHIAHKQDHQQFITATQRIITAHGFKITKDWEYELYAPTHEVVCLRIWIGRTRTKKNVRVLKLTDEEQQQIVSLIPFQ